MSKKGSMELSVNSIVILVIAIVMLGLILGFVKSRMDKLDINPEIPDPIPATAGNTITLSSGDTISISQGGKTDVKISMYNNKVPAGVDTGVLTNAKPAFTCTGGLVLEANQVLPQTINPGESKIYYVVLKSTAGLKGQYACRITAVLADSTIVPGIERDLFVEVK